MLGVKLPIIGAPMFLVSFPDLVVAVSETGGLGSFPALNYRSLEGLKQGILEIQQRTTQPFAVNIVLHPKHNPTWKEQLRLSLDLGVKVFITSLGSPRSIVHDIHRNGAHILADATTLRHALLLQKSGVDAIIAVAQGAGGHAGAISPFALIPYFKENLSIPVIAAGAISGGKQMAASFVLGADAVYLGTRFLASSEAASDASYKKAVLDADPEDIVYTDQVSGIPGNWIAKTIPADFHPQKMSEVKRWRDIYSAGHGVGSIKSILSIREIIHEMVSEYLQVMSHHCKPFI